MRLHRGLAGQAPDPLIAAAEGAGRTPGYRSLAYVVFENLALADFGNRLPNLSFEVIADEDSTGRDWLADLVRTADASVGVLGPAGAIGFVAEEGRWRENAEVLALWLDAPVAFPDGRLKLGGPPRVVEIPASDVGATADPAEEVPSPERTLAVERRPAAWSAGHFDPARDYQRGVQTEWRPRPGRDMSLEAPVVASAAQARSVAARLLRRAEAAAETLELRLPFRWLWLAVGDVLRVEGIPGRWRIVRQRVEHGTVLVSCAALPPNGAAAPAAADPGRALPAPLVVVPPTELVLLEPAHDPWDAEAPPALFVAAAGRPGWTGAEVGVAPAGDPEVRPLGRLPAGRWAGRLLEALPPGPSTLWDEGNAILVETDGENDGPESRPARSVLAGANMLAVGAELLQFRTSEHLGGRLFRLSGLLRARGGVSAPAGGHPAGTRVAAVDRAQLLKRPIQADEPGLSLLLWAEGRGDPPGGTEFLVRLEGSGHAPLAPCHARVERLSNGSLRFSWIPRDRASVSWAPGRPGEPARPMVRWQLEQPLPLERTVSGPAFVWPLEDQQASAGGAVRSGQFRLVAIGPGPLAVRAGPMIPFSV